jgi:hypothetical protein
VKKLKPYELKGFPMAKLLSLMWLLFSIFVSYGVCEILKDHYMAGYVMASPYKAVSYLSSSAILVFVAICPYISALFLWKRINSWFAYIVAAIYAIYFVALLVFGEDEGMYRYLASLPGIIFCVITIVAASKLNL